MDVLVVSPQPCVYRKRATHTLDRIGRTWRITYTSPSVAGARAAVLAGLGVTVLPVTDSEEAVTTVFKVGAMLVIVLICSFSSSFICLLLKSSRC